MSQEGKNKTEGNKKTLPFSLVTHYIHDELLALV